MRLFTKILVGLTLLACLVASKASDRRRLLASGAPAAPLPFATGRTLWWDVTNFYNYTNGQPIGFWTNMVASGFNLSNFSGTAVYSNTPTPIVTAISGTACYFSNANSGFNGLNYMGKTNATIALRAWCRNYPGYSQGGRLQIPSTSSSTNILFGFYGYTSFGADWALSSGTKGVYIYNQSPTWFDAWHNFMLTCRDTNVVLYKDGTNQLSYYNVGEMMNMKAFNFYLYCDSIGGPGSFRVKRLLVWDYPMTQTEITDLNTWMNAQP